MRKIIQIQTTIKNRFTLYNVVLIVVGLVSIIPGLISFIEWTFPTMLLMFFIPVYIWALGFFVFYFSSNKTKKIAVKYSYKFLLGSFLSASIIIFLLLILRIIFYQYFSIIILGMADLALFLIIGGLFGTAQLTTYLSKKRLSELNIIKGIENSTFPAGLAAFSLLLTEFTSRKISAKLAVIFFIISAFSLMLYTWNINLKGKKDPAATVFLRIMAIGSFLTGLLFLLLVALPITIKDIEIK